MMDQNDVLRLAPQLADAVLAYDTVLIEGANPASAVARLVRREMTVLAADLKAAQAEPQKFTPWTPYCPRNAS